MAENGRGRRFGDRRGVHQRQGLALEQRLQEILLPGRRRRRERECHAPRALVDFNHGPAAPAHIGAIERLPVGVLEIERMLRPVQAPLRQAYKKPDIRGGKTGAGDIGAQHAADHLVDRNVIHRQPQDERRVRRGQIARPAANPGGVHPIDIATDDLVLHHRHNLLASWVRASWARAAGRPGARGMRIRRRRPALSSTATPRRHIARSGSGPRPRRSC